MKKLFLAILMIALPAAAASDDINAYSQKIFESNMKDMQADIKELTRLYYQLEKSAIPKEDVSELKETLKDLNEKLEGVDLKDMKEKVEAVEKDQGRVWGDITWMKIIGGTALTVLGVVAYDALKSYITRRRNGNGLPKFYIKPDDVPWWVEMASKAKDKE